MRRSTSRSLYLAAFLGSVVLALRPDPRAERAASALFVPARALAEACAPLRWLRLRSARAAESALIGRELEEQEARQRLHELQRAATLPSNAELLAHRRFVHAEVIERLSGSMDALVVRVDGADSTGLVAGMPVTHGDDFVGRVAQVDVRRPGVLLVELVTSRDFAVGARLAASDETGAPIRCVVGGLAARSRLRGELRLALATPSRRDLPATSVRVDETLSDLAPYAAQSLGFRLGQVEASPSGEYVVAPALEFRSGVFRVAIVIPDDSPRPAGLAPHEPLFDARWAPARVLSRSAGRREGFEVSVGAESGVRDGAAFVVGARLVGRVERAGWLQSSVATLGDPGWLLPAVALPQAPAGPIALGALVALGRARRAPGEVEYVWRSPGLSGFEADSLEVQIFTGSGQPGLPSGLWLGVTRLPTAAGEHVLRIDHGVDNLPLQRGFVRVAEAAP